MLPPPKDPYFRIPEMTEEEFLNTNQDWVEDEDLLATGAWDDDPDIEVEDIDEGP